MKRWKIINGEVMAGNDNAPLIKDGIAFLHKLEAAGHATMEDVDHNIATLKGK
jgi:hypothetical protein